MDRYCYTCFLDDGLILYNTREEAEDALRRACEDDINIFYEWLDETVNASTMLQMVFDKGVDDTMSHYFNEMIEDYSVRNIWKYDRQLKIPIFD